MESDYQRLMIGEERKGKDDDKEEVKNDRFYKDVIGRKMF